MKMLWCFLAFSLAGWAFLAYGLISMLRYNRRQRTELEQADAVFVHYIKKAHSTGRYSWKYGYHPVLDFSAEGKQYRVQSRVYHWEQKLRPGDIVPLFYDRNNPSRFHLEEENHESGSWMVRVGWIWIAASAVLSLLAQIFIFR